MKVIRDIFYTLWFRHNIRKLDAGKPVFINDLIESKG